MSETLQGKVALVTGAGKRIGHALALRLAREGADVAVHFGGSQQEAEKTVDEIRALGRRAMAVRAELRSVPQIREMFAKVAKEFGRLDVLVNSAANFLQTEFAETTEEVWDSALETNLKGVFFCCQAAAPELKKSRGVIVNFADLGGILAWTEFIPHCAAKAGVVMLTKALAKELAPEVRVNAIAPGTITMPGDAPEIEAEFVRRAPLKRSGRTEDVADAVMYLIGARFVTGHVLVLDGGRSLV
ncbi:MAG TPA: SDR family oxidoreductase [Candidatus Acidoferrales bacterium]|nr:SDR family oxidoreductase [Candidatus Acidoferrales bacterium]